MLKLFEACPPLEEMITTPRAPAVYPKGRRIPMDEPNALSMVASGIVRIYRPDERGEAAHVDFYATGHVFAGHKQQLGYVAVAFGPCSVFHWSTAELQRMAEREPRILMAIARVIAEQNARLLDIVTRLNRGKIRERLLLVFEDMERIGSEEDGAIVVRPGVPHDILRTMLDTSREIVTQHMNELRRAGGIEYSRKALVIYPSRLKAKAKGAAA